MLGAVTLCSTVALVKYRFVTMQQYQLAVSLATLETTSGGRDCAEIHFGVRGY